jgi:hypothetical protein
MLSVNSANFASEVENFQGLVIIDLLGSLVWTMQNARAGV